MTLLLWQACLEQLAKETSQQQFDTFIKPLQAKIDNNELTLLAPNHFIKKCIEGQFLQRIEELVSEKKLTNCKIDILLEVGSNESHEHSIVKAKSSSPRIENTRKSESVTIYHASRLNSAFTFENFVEGKSNQLAKAACYQVAENPGSSYNPLLLYGGVGLGKTHLMHAVGKFILNKNPRAKILYLHSERFVADMVKALQTNSMNNFKAFYCSLDVLLIDDIQFLAGKE